MTVSKKTRDDKGWQGCGERGILVLHCAKCKLLCTTMGNSMRVLQVLKIERHVIQQFHFWVCIWRKWNHYVKEDICNNKSKKDRQILNDLTYICVETKIILNELIEKEISLWPDSKFGELDEGSQKKQASIYKTMCCLSSQLCLTLRPHGLQTARLFYPWGFSRQEYWGGLPCPPPGDLPHPGIKPRSPALQTDSLLSELPGKSNRIGLGQNKG